MKTQKINLSFLEDWTSLLRLLGSRKLLSWLYGDFC